MSGKLVLERNFVVQIATATAAATAAAKITTAAAAVTETAATAAAVVAAATAAPGVCPAIQHGQLAPEALQHHLGGVFFDT